MANKGTIKSTLKKDREKGDVWFDGQTGLYGFGPRQETLKKPKSKKPRPVKARGGSSGETPR